MFGIIEVRLSDSQDRNSDTEQQNPITVSHLVGKNENSPARIKKQLILKLITFILLALIVVLGVENTEVYKAEAQKEIQVIEIVEVKTDNPEVELKIREAFPDNYEVMLAVAQAESGLNPNALNPEKHYGCSGSRGIFQIACVHVDDPELLYDVDYNIEVAKGIYESQGLKPWGAYTDGNYLAYLN